MICMKLLPRLIALLLLTLPLSVFAHGYWIETQGSHQVNQPVTIRLYYGEYMSGERLSGSTLDKMKEIRVSVSTPAGEQVAVTMKQLADYWEGNFTPQTEGGYTITGINDEREVQDWNRHGLGIVRPVQYLKAIYQVGGATTALSPSSFLDVAVSKPQGSSYAIQSFKNNVPFAGATILVTHPGGEETTLVADKDGKATFTVDKPGLYLVGIEWIDKTPGQFKQKNYETVRHQLDYSLYL